MRPTLSASISIVLLLAFSFAAGQTNPLARVPATQVAVTDPTLLVLPIADPPTGDHRGLGRAIQQDMLADLTTMTRARVIAPAAAAPAVDEQSALAEAHQYAAAYVVWGQAQVSANELRVTGQLLDAASNQPLAALKATAPVDNLFPLEDSLAAQAAQALPPSLRTVPPAQTQPSDAPASPTASTTTAQPLPSTTTGEPYYSTASTESSAPYYSYTATLPQTYYVYNTYYTYPGYWYYPYWGWYGGIGFVYGGYWYHHGWYGHGWYPHGYYWGRPGYHGHPYGAGVPRGGGGTFHGGAGAGHFGGGGGGGAHVR